jgi:hypothetical protein
MIRWLAVGAVLLAGCASPERSSTDGIPTEADRQSLPGEPMSAGRDASGAFTVHADAAVSSCIGGQPEVGYRLNWQHVTLRQRPDDTSVQVDFAWAATNPTNDWLKFRVVEDERMGGPALLEWSGVSPQALLLVGQELEALPETFYVQVSATGCVAESPAGVHLSPEDQPVEWTVAWNTQTQG